MYGGGYGGMGGMGGMGYGGGMGGGMYGGAPGLGGPGVDPTEETWAMRAEQNSRPAFEAIQQIVMAFGQVAMMLDASFGAMFQSFRAVIGVMDHFGRMRHVVPILHANGNRLRVLGGCCDSAGDVDTCCKPPREKFVFTSAATRQAKHYVWPRSPFLIELDYLSGLPSLELILTTHHYQLIRSPNLICTALEPSGTALEACSPHSPLCESRGNFLLARFVLLALHHRLTSSPLLTNFLRLVRVVRMSRRGRRRGRFGSSSRWRLAAHT
jgi:hypothetical protein